MMFLKGKINVTPQNNRYACTDKNSKFNFQLRQKHSCPSCYIIEERERESATNRPFLKNLTITHLTTAFALRYWKYMVFVFIGKFVPEGI